MPVQKITEVLQLSSLGNRPWFIQACCATSGEGLYEGLDWLSNAMAGRLYQKAQKDKPAPAKEKKSAAHQKTKNPAEETAEGTSAGRKWTLWPTASLEG
eukprot:NODE_15157_length_329_cov_4.242857_g13993_i0.p2 GENE.NODE_15157_length_329_cov_4.242857_g13993_i0~~NODE_15157_length_329_cov_4.242857_g13993_i0.p2  ORF type:complete len:108 (-),score=20.88 NODE_15157_length_329_cov_4.242857_g13993_i0:6-302(-)